VPVNGWSSRKDAIVTIAQVGMAGEQMASLLAGYKLAPARPA